MEIIILNEKAVWQDIKSILPDVKEQVSAYKFNEKGYFTQIRVQAPAADVTKV